MKIIDVQNINGAAQLVVSTSDPKATILLDVGGGASPLGTRPSNREIIRGVLTQPRSIQEIAETAGVSLNETTEAVKAYLDLRH
jgi:hypothetical protein